MQINAVQLTPVLREICWALRDPATKLGKLINNISYRLATRLQVEEQIEQMVGDRSGVTVVFPGMTPLPVVSHSHEPLPEDMVMLVRNQLSKFNNSILQGFNVAVMPVRSEFQQVLGQIGQKVAHISSICLCNPEVLKDASIYKEEAEALANIFSVLSEEAGSSIEVSVSYTPQGTVVVVKEPVADAYRQASRVFKRLAEKLPLLPREDPNKLNKVS